ncbi:MAG: PorP/SprF family type IX secretion system membrane protein [Flammeovirgaceae bacterium]
MTPIPLKHSLSLFCAICLLLMGVQQSNAQDPNFTQFYISPINLNPAFTGTTPHYRFTSIYRNQWLSIPESYETNIAAFEYNWDYYSSGIGVILSNDRAQDFGYMSNSLQISYAYAAQLTKTRFLRFGLQAGYVLRNFGYSNLLFSDQITNGGATQEDFENVLQGFPDFSFGTVYYSSLFWAGVAVHHFNTPRLNAIGEIADRYPARLSAHMGGRFVFKNGKKEVFKVQPAVLFERQGDFMKYTAGVNLASSALFAGVWLRAFTNGGQDAASLLVGFRKNSFKLAYSYDQTISDAAGKTGGSHEISITIEPSRDNRYKGKSKWSKFLECPVVF